MGHAFNTRCNLNKGTKRHEFGHRSLDDIAFGNLCQKSLLFLFDLFIEKISPGNHYIPALFLKPGNQKMMCLTQIVFRGFHIPDIHLADRTEGSLPQDIHREPPFDNLGNFAFNRGEISGGIFKHGCFSGTGNCLGQDDFTFTQGNHI